MPCVGRWMDDGESSICCGCGSPFTLLRRRHHCRRCGQLFCDACSSLRSPLARDEMADGSPLLQDEPVQAARLRDREDSCQAWRVCKGCHQQVLLTPLAAWGTAPGAPRKLSVSEALASLHELSAKERDALDDRNANDGSSGTHAAGSLAQRWLSRDGSAYHNGEIVPTGLAELADLDQGSTIADKSGGHAADILDEDEVQQKVRARYCPNVRQTDAVVFPLIQFACTHLFMLRVDLVIFRWAAALLDSDPDLSHLRFVVVPSAVPETIFWRRYWRLAWSQLREHSLSLSPPAVGIDGCEPQPS
jgi:hypothetical protein